MKIVYIVTSRTTKSNVKSVWRVSIWMERSVKSTQSVSIVYLERMIYVRYASTVTLKINNAPSTISFKFKIVNYTKTMGNVTNVMKVIN